MTETGKRRSETGGKIGWKMNGWKVGKGEAQNFGMGKSRQPSVYSKQKARGLRKIALKQNVYIMQHR